MPYVPSWLVLEKEDWEEADKISNERHELAIRLNRPPRNRAPQSVVPHRIGTRCEIAGWLYLRPILWQGRAVVVDITKLPDYAVGDLFINCKGRSQSWYDLIVQWDDPPEWAYLLVRGHDHPRYEISGWCWGHEAQTRPITDPAGDRPAHFIKQDDPIIKPPYTLLDEVRKRQHLGTWV
jgi:hypothetical protein